VSYSRHPGAACRGETFLIPRNEERMRKHFCPLLAAPVLFCHLAHTQPRETPRFPTPPPPSSSLS
jgi:hypothetical protein